MPDLFSVGDNEDVDNLYSGKKIIYVEGTDDVKVFSELLGPSLRDRIEFKVVKTEGGGCTVVIAEVNKRRPKNRNIFGLLDGEAVVAIGGLKSFLHCRSTLFTYPATANDRGLIFLAGNELESLLLLYGSIVEHICRDVDLANIGARTPENVMKTLRPLILRFFGAAVLKFAAQDFLIEKKNYPVVGVGSYHMSDPVKSSMTIFRELRKGIKKDPDLDWPAFRANIRKIISLIRTRLREDNAGRDALRAELLRLSDGKELLKSIRKHYKTPSQTWNGHLFDGVMKTDFPAQFQSELLALVR